MSPSCSEYGQGTLKRMPNAHLFNEKKKEKKKKRKEKKNFTAVSLQRHCPDDQRIFART